MLAIISSLLYIACFFVHRWAELNTDANYLLRIALIFVGAVGAAVLGACSLALFFYSSFNSDILTGISLLAGLGGGIYTNFHYKDPTLFNKVLIIVIAACVVMAVKAIFKKLKNK